MKKAAINIIGADACTGCSLCDNTCPFDAIEMTLDADGFVKPLVSADKCRDCGVCAKTCPVIFPDIREGQYMAPVVYGGWSNDADNLMHSSSGGLFFEIASGFIRKGGVVCGVRWGEGRPVYDVAETVEQLKAMRGSKYLQAEVGDIYRRVKAFVEGGIRVLFVGLPCQIQAVLNLVHSNRLFVIDVVCAGVPSMLMYRKYCEETFGDSAPVTFTNFRDKNPGVSEPWRGYFLSFYSGERLLRSEPHGENQFFLAFNSTKVYGSACYSCQFNAFPRHSDLTLCDFWGADSENENNHGTSLLAINNPKGLDLLALLASSDIRLESVDADKAVAGTRRLNMGARPRPHERASAFKTLRERGFNAMYGKFIRPSVFRRIAHKIGL